MNFKNITTLFIMMAATIIFIMTSASSSQSHAASRSSDYDRAPTQFSTTPSTNALGPVVATNFIQPEPQEWQPKAYKYSIGYERAELTTPLGENAVAFGFWSDKIGLEFFLGYMKESDTKELSTTTAVADASSASSAEIITKSYTGRAKATTITIGVKPKFRFYQNNWVQIYGGLLAGIGKKGNTSSPTGTHTESFADKSDRSNYSVAETNYGTITTETTMQYFIGPQLGSEFYLKWFPHLALGFSAGIYYAGGGQTTTTESTSNITYAVVDGVKQTSTAYSTSQTSTVSTPGTSSSTFGVGGDYFSFFNTRFTLRYVW